MSYLGTFTSGEILSAAELNQFVGMCILRSTTNQSVNSATGTALTFGAGTETLDPNGWHSTSVNTGRITPTVAGYYLITGYNLWAGNAGTAANARIVLNATVIADSAGDQSATGTSSGATVETFYYLNGTTDYVTLQGYQNSGAAVNSVARQFAVALLRGA